MTYQIKSINRYDGTKTILTLSTLIFGILILISFTPIPSGRYVKYSMPFFCLIISLFSSSTTKGKHIFVNDFYFLFQNLLIIIVPSLIAFVNDDSFVNRFIEETYFIISPLVSILILSKYYEIKSHFGGAVIILFFYILSFLTEKVIFGGLNNLSIFNPLTFVKFLLYSEADGESHSSFTFGLLAIFFYNKRRKILMLISIFFVVLAAKRIVIFSTIIALLIIIFFKKNNLQKNKNILIILIIISNLIIPYLLIVISNGTLDDFIQDTFDVDTPQLTQGRGIWYKIAFDHFNYPNFFGQGVGSIQTYLHSFLGEWSNLHSDLLKNLYEFGIIVYIYWLYIFYKRSFANIYILSFTIYLNCLYITDNVFIYFDVMFVFYYLIICYQSTHNKIQVDQL